MGGARRSSKRPFFPRLNGSGPVPISAIYDSLNDKLEVTFSEAIASSGYDVSPWFVRIGNNQRGVDSIEEVIGPTVTLQLSGSLANPGPNIVSYSPPPEDLVTDPGGDPVPGFTNFPIA